MCIRDSIKGIVKRLCESFGAPLGPGIHAFPPPEQIARLHLDDLAPLRAGFRAKYILDAAQKVADGTIDLEAARTLPLEQARAHLMQIMGVGPKVAECALLYGLHRLEAFPVDVWMKRVLERFYPNGFPPVECPGVAQQYLFHSVRSVSYTHLDVYKRQVLPSVTFPRRSMTPALNIIASASEVLPDPA